MPSPGSSRELFATRPGFVLAAAGSAVGLGNMWRFPYQAAEGGGAAFVLLYVLMTFLIGVPIMASEFAIGRRSKRSPIGAYRSIGGTAWVPMGYLAVLTPLVILAYFSVIAGWTLRYAIDGLSGFSGDFAVRFGEVSSGTPAVVYHLILMIITVAVVYRGVRKGIEHASLILMPLLFVLLIGLVIWASNLPGSGQGYSFYLQPSFDELLNPTVIKQAAAQAFLSLSVGMGIMITYSSYLDHRHDLGQEAVTVSMFDFSVAFIGGLVVFPVIFALGLSDQVGESTIGALFISIPAAIAEMGDAGQVVGIVFFIALLVAGLTSLISLLEVVVSSLMDGFGMRRGPSTLTAGVLAAAAGILPASSLSALGMMDKIASEVFVIAGALGSLVLAGWILKNPLEEIHTGASPLFARIAPGLMFTIRYLAPAFVAIVLWLSISDFV
ncbi:MAG: sodium-dependent transporter [Woeseiaceae bacterium]|nr:sodium-dependent transporter [Woeseiaceae bacterium]